MIKKRQTLLLLPLSLLLCAGVSSLAAEPDASYPSRPVRLVVGYAPGGTTDVIARLIARALTTALGQPFVVDNRPGANSNLGTEVVVRSPPDGYNLLLGTISNATNATMYKNASFDITRDLVPIASIGIVPNVLVVPATSSIKTFDEYLAFAQANPGKMTFASAGSGSSIHLSGERFKSMAKVDMLHVPYRGSSPALTDLIAGQVGSMFDNLPSSLPQIQGGKLTALAVTSPARVPSLPNVPTIAEKGFAGFALCVARSIGGYPIQVLAVKVGNRQPLGVGAGGLAILATLPRAEQMECIKSNADRLRGYGTMNASTLLAITKTTQRRGHAVIGHYSVPGVIGIGVALRNSNLEVVGAITTASVDTRMTRIDQQSAVRCVERHVAEIQARLDAL